MSVAVYILILLAALIALGTSIPQQQPAYFYTTTYGTLAAHLLSLSGLTDVYRSPLVWALGTVLFLSLTVCVAHLHGPRKLAYVWNFLKAWLTNQPLPKGKDPTYTPWRKPIRSMGYLLLHAGLPMMLLGAALDALYGFKGVMVLREGEADNRAWFTPEAEAPLQARTLPFSVCLHQFETHFFATGMPKDFISTVSFTPENSLAKEKRTEGQGLEGKTAISVNHPVTIKGYRLFQSSFGDGGSSVTFRVIPVTVEVQEQASLPALSAGLIHGTYTQSLPNGMSVKLQDFRLHTVVPAEPPSTEKSSATHLVPASAQHFQDEGPSLDYTVEQKGVRPLRLRSYLFAPDKIGVISEAGEVETVWLGLRLTEKTPLRQAVISAASHRENNIKEITETLTPALKALPEKERMQTGLQAVQAVKVLQKLKPPMLLQLTDFEEKQYTVLQVTHAPFAWAFWLGGILSLVGGVGLVYDGRIKRKDGRNV